MRRRPALFDKRVLCTGLRVLRDRAGWQKRPYNDVGCRTRKVKGKRNKLVAICPLAGKKWQPRHDLPDRNDRSGANRNVVLARLLLKRSTLLASSTFGCSRPTCPQLMRLRGNARTPGVGVNVKGAKKTTQEKEKLPERNVVPGGQRTSHLFRERLDGYTTQLPCCASSPDSISSNHVVDETVAGLHADRRRSAVRRNVAGTLPMQTLPRGCFASIPISNEKI